MEQDRTRAIAAAVEDRTGRAVEFLLEADKLKQVERRNRLADNSRREFTAEHSWHFALAALVLADLADDPVDVARVAAIGLVHDIVEIDAGDTFVYDEAAAADKETREREAANRLFSIDDSGPELRALWDEYEAQETAEARFARSLDRFLPLLLNHASGGGSWVEHEISLSAATEVNSAMAPGSSALWDVAQALLADAAQRGLLKS